MNADRLRELVQRQIEGALGPDEHEELQEALRSDPAARAAFRELMDLETGLRVWAAERAATGDGAAPTPVGGVRRGRRRVTGFALAASVALVVLSWWLWPPRSDLDPDAVRTLGSLHQQAGCVWRGSPEAVDDDRFTVGSLALEAGVARLGFDSGTDLVIEGPCVLDIVSARSARIRHGNVAVEVLARSDGFLLETPDARILDEGTEYAVSVREEDTEVHVFDGAVVWEPSGGETRERIEAGEARRYARSRPGRGARVPLDARRFVRRLEEDLRESAGGDLLAYDGFEYLAGKLRRGRHGFGWSGGWRSVATGRGTLAAVVDAPDDVVFGIERTGRRLLRLVDGESLRRDLANPLALEPGRTVHVGILCSRHPREGRTGRRLALTLQTEPRRPRGSSRGSVAVGIDAEGFPFVACGESVARGSEVVADGEAHLLVARILVASDGRLEVRLRVHRPGEPVDASEPGSWTAAATAGRAGRALTGVRFEVGARAVYHVDELKIGSTWTSVVGVAPDGR